MKVERDETGLVHIELPEDPMSLAQVRALLGMLQRLVHQATPSESVRDFANLVSGQLPEEWTPASDLYERYESWCKRTRRIPVALKVFGRSMRTMGVPYKRDNSRRRYRL